jgi:peroxiredoxin
VARTEPPAPPESDAPPAAPAGVDAATTPPTGAAPVGAGRWRSTALFLGLAVLAVGGGYLVGRWLSGEPAGAGRFDGRAAPPAPAGATAAADSVGLTVEVAPSGWARLGEPAPDFALASPGGEPVSLSDYAGRPIVLNFWASWCQPCRAEMPFLESLYQAHQDRGLVVLAVNVQEAPEVARAFGAELGLSFPLLLDEHGTIATQYRVQTLPMTYLIDRTGRIATHQRGMFASEEELEKRLRPLLVDES